MSSALIAQGCFDPRFDADELGDGVNRPTDLFTPDAGDKPVCTTPDPSPLTALRVRVRTTPAGGRFKPRNVGAIWIERADGTFVKTLERWGITRAKWLTRWVAASSSDVTDAITGATQVSHTTHEPTWDLTGLDACEIATGDYRVVFELTDKSATGISGEIPFSKDQLPTTITPADQTSFHDLQLILE